MMIMRDLQELESEISSDLGNFIINEPEYKKEEFKSIIIKPLDVSKYVKEFFITPFQIFMSATVNRDSFAKIWDLRLRR